MQKILLKKTKFEFKFGKYRKENWKPPTQTPATVQFAIGNTKNTKQNMQKNTEQTTKKENLNSNFGNSEKKIGTVPFAIGNTKNSNVYNLQPTGNTRQEIENTKKQIQK